MLDFTDLAQFYKALGDETRLRLIQLLTAQKLGSARCVGSLAKALGTTPPNVSQHLRILKDLDLVQSRRLGYQVHYFINPQAFKAYERLSAEIIGRSIFHTGGKTSSEESTLDKKEANDCSPQQIRARHGESGHPPH